MSIANSDSGKTVTHEDLARVLGVSVTTIKNYRRQFGAFLPVAREGRPLRFHASALDVCLRIRSLFAEGLSVSKISEVLLIEFPSFYSNRHLSKVIKFPAKNLNSEEFEHSEIQKPISAHDLSQRLETVETLFENTNRRVGRVEKLLEDLFALHNRANTLQNELLAKLEVMDVLPAWTDDAKAVRGKSKDQTTPVTARVQTAVLFDPPVDLAPLPVVIFSELGEFLGVTDRKGRPFTLKEFQAFLERRAAGLGKFESKWSQDQDAWVLTFGGSGTNQGQIHDHYFRRTKTSKGNLVAHFYQLRINGNIVSKAFLHAFLRQIKDSLE